VSIFITAAKIDKLRTLFAEKRETRRQRRTGKPSAGWSRLAECPAVPAGYRVIPGKILERRVFRLLRKLSIFLLWTGGILVGAEFVAKMVFSATLPGTPIFFAVFFVGMVLFVLANYFRV
jgi:hypothetical protein